MIYYASIHFLIKRNWGNSKKLMSLFWYFNWFREVDVQMCHVCRLSGIPRLTIWTNFWVFWLSCDSFVQCHSNLDWFVSFILSWFSFWGDFFEIPSYFHTNFQFYEPFRRFLASFWEIFQDSNVYTDLQRIFGCL